MRKISALFVGLLVGASFACGDDLPGPADGGADAGVTDGSEPADAGVFVRCPRGGTSIEGTVDGIDVRLTADGYGRFRSIGSATNLVSTFGADGLAYTASSTTIDSVPSAAQGALFVDSDETLGAGYCFGDGSMVSTGFDLMQLSLDLEARALRRLSSCEDATATTDSLTYCRDPNNATCQSAGGSSVAHAFTGTVLGEPVDEVLSGAGAGRVFATLPDGSWSAYFAGGRGYAKIDGAGQGTLLWRGPDAADPVIAYCVDAASMVPFDPSPSGTISFTSLRLRGRCDQAPEVPGSLRVCAGGSQ